MPHPLPPSPHFQDHGDLEKQIKFILDQRGLQLPHSYVTKVIQLYDTMNVRFGVMLVGPTGGGKSECYRTLQGATTRLRAQMNHKDVNFQVGAIDTWEEIRTAYRLLHGRSQLSPTMTQK